MEVGEIAQLASSLGVNGVLALGVYMLWHQNKALSQRINDLTDRHTSWIQSLIPTGTESTDGES